MACGSSSRGIASLMVEFQAGDSSAVQQPATKISTSSVVGPAQPASSSAASSTPVAACVTRASWIRRRRSVMSAHTPAGKASRNIGRKTAVCTSAARKAEPVSSTIIQAAAMVCIALPTKYRPPASHKLRNTSCRNVAQMECEGLETLTSALFRTWVCQVLQQIAIIANHLRVELRCEY